MLFSSYDFIFLFLPLTLLGYSLSAKLGRSAAVIWLLFASLVFYGWWNPPYLALILTSILFNHVVGTRLAYAPSRALLTVGVAFNLLLIAYFKYAGFFQDIVNELSGSQITAFSGIILPIAISFFTFQQITYLVDSYKGLVERHSFIEYALFITFFPQLLAGPIVHHQEIIGQFHKRFTSGLRANDVAIGLTIFAIGLIKKVVIADSMVPYVDPVFGAAAAGAPVYIIEAWGAALAFTLQIYFDFSGYSDMAIGLGLIFSIRLPINFASPYQARSIIEFWRRWHMTLSRFLRDYLYYPLGGNRKGEVRRFTNIMIVMCIGGLWHGAAWNFILWGTLHGLYLLINHACRLATPPRWRRAIQETRPGAVAAWFLTMLYPDCFHKLCPCVRIVPHPLYPNPHQTGLFGKWHNSTRTTH